jgi:HAD superfamily hydrolase (TIGR01509 family)
MKFDAVIFDLDGTLVDNMHFHNDAWLRFGELHGLPPLDMSQRARFDGKRNREILPDVFGRELTDAEQTRFAEEKEQVYRELSKARLAPMPGLLRFLDLLDARGVAVAIATSAPVENVSHALAEIGLGERLTRIMRSDQVGRGKPFPDVFLAAAKLLGSAPERCLAFEDAPLGIVAAKAAGMACAALTTTFSREAMLAAGATPDVVVADFNAYIEDCGDWLQDRDGRGNGLTAPPV